MEKKNMSSLYIMVPKTREARWLNREARWLNREARWLNREARWLNRELC
jgi:hypothetical protein